MNWFGLIFVAAGGASAWFSWRWSIPCNESVHEMFSVRPIEPGSCRYRMLRINRWGGVVVGSFFAVAGLGLLFSGH